MSPNDALGQIERKLIVCGGHRCMCREDAHLPYGIDVAVVCCRPARGAEAFGGKLQHEQRRVPLVQVKSVDMVIAKGAEHPDAADPEHGLLGQPVRGITAVQEV